MLLKRHQTAVSSISRKGKQKLCTDTSFVFFGALCNFCQWWPESLAEILPVESRRSHTIDCNMQAAYL